MILLLYKGFDGECEKRFLPFGSEATAKNTRHRLASTADSLKAGIVSCTLRQGLL